MALKPDRNVVLDDISFYMNVTGERGGVVVYSTGGSGAAMDTSLALVAFPTTIVSGTRAAGVLMNDVVNLDLTRQHLNEHKDEVQINSKVTLLKRGWIVTNKVSGTPTVGAPAFYNSVGSFTPSETTDGGNLTTTVPNNNQVGTFMGVTDADGYVKVAVNIN